MRQRTRLGIAFALTALLGLPLGIGLRADDESRRKESKTGFLIPSQCRPDEGAARPQGPYDEWPAPHTTECALREACIASGYGLWVMEDKVFYRLDETGQQLALDYFRTTRRTSYNKVEIIGDFRDAEAVRITEMNETD